MAKSGPRSAFCWLVAKSAWNGRHHFRQQIQPGRSKGMHIGEPVRAARFRVCANIPPARPRQNRRGKRHNHVCVTAVDAIGSVLRCKLV